MATVYPGTIDSYTNPSAASPRNSPSLAGSVSNLNDAMVAVQTALGTNPKASAANVGARIGATETNITTLAQSHVLQFGREGALTVRAGKGRFRFPFAVTILGISATADTAPTGAAVILDVDKNGTTIFTTQANRPQIAAGANAAAEVTNMDVTAYAAGDYITVDIDQVGSTIAGSDLTVIVRYQRP